MIGIAINLVSDLENSKQCRVLMRQEGILVLIPAPSLISQATLEKFFTLMSQFSHPYSERVRADGPLRLPRTLKILQPLADEGLQSFISLNV